MDNFPFVIWMLLYPLFYSLEKYLNGKTTPLKIYSESVVFLSALTQGAIYIFVAFKLYRG